jgi:hypothetical protein
MPPKPFKASEEEKGPARDYALYQRIRVSKTDGLESLIGGHYRSGKDTVKYYSDLGATDAAEMAKHALAFSHSGKQMVTAGVITGAVIGILRGAFVASQVPAQEKSFISVPDLEGPFQGLVAGVLTCGIFDLGVWSLYHWHYHRKASLEFSEAANSFNRHIAGKMNLQIIPTASGAAGALKFTY